MRKVIGGILLAAGVLIAGGSGLCSLALLGSMFSGPSDPYVSVPLVLIFGGIPFLVGVALFFAGRAVIRSDRQG